MAVLSAGLTGVVQKDASCTLCAAHTALDTSPTPGSDVRDDRDDVVAWLGVLAGAVLLASLGDGAQRWLGVGAVVAVAATALCAVLSVRVALRRVRSAHARQVHALAEDADGRVATVIRQFEWAVNDVVHLKRQIERGEAAVDALLDRAQERERYIRSVERELLEARSEIGKLATTTGEPGPFAPLVEEVTAPHFRWALHHDGHRPNVELECVATTRRPTRLRILDANGDIVMTSGTPMRTEDGATLFSLSKPPGDLLDALESGRPLTHTFQALVDYAWCGVTIEDSLRRTKVVSDKQGRTYRVTDTERMLALRDGDAARKRRRKREPEPPVTFAQLS